MIIAGVDYSMTSPSICVHTGDNWSVKNCVFYYMVQKDKHLIITEHVRGSLYPSWNVPEERFHNLASWSYDIFRENNVSFVAIEGYSYGSSSSRLFQIAENGGTLKQMLWKNDVKFSVIAPTSVKKTATGKGNANKEKMWDSFIDETNLNLFNIIGQEEKKHWNPVSDMVDAYYLAKHYFVEMNS
jgi:Holliday junction resolvasome RuvABC endonuclease subunit